MNEFPPQLLPANFAAASVGLEIIEAAPVAMLVSDRSGVILFGNAEARRLLGYVEAELRGLGVAALLEEKHLGAWQAFLAGFWRQPERRPVGGGPEFPLRRKDGREIWVQLGLNPVAINGATYALGALLDIAERKQAEEQRAESERMMRAILDHSFEFIGLLDREGRMLRANQTALREAGARWEEVQGRYFWETPWWTHAGAEQEKLRDAVARAARGEFVRFETTHRGAGGRMLDIDFSLTPVRDDHGLVTALIPEGRDITERKAAERALRESEERFSKAFRASPDAISVSDMATGRILDVNEGFERLAGFSRADLVGRTSSELGLWSDPADRARMLAGLAKDGALRDMRVKARSRDGTLNSFLLSAEKVDIGGRPCLVIVSRDVTAQLEAEQALRASEELFSKAFRASPDAIAITDIETGRYLDANGGHEQIFGFTREEIIGRTTIELGYYQDPKDRDKMVAQICAHGSVRNLELACYNRRREPITVLYSGEAIEMNGRTVLVSVVHDITARKRADEALRESEEKFAKAFQLSPDIMSLSDYETGCYLEVNEAHVKLFGYSRAECIGRTPLDVGLVDAVDRGAEMRELLEQHGRFHDLKIKARTRDGRTLVLLLSAETITLGGRRCILRASRDITAMLNAEEATRESEEKFAKAFRASPYSLTISELATGRYIDVNAGFERISGYTRDEVIGRTSHELGLWQYPADREELVRRLQRDGAVSKMELSFKRRDQVTVVALCSCELVDIGGAPCLLNTLEDITERRQAEQQKVALEAQLRQNQKLEALGTLAGGIAHDFNNILTAIIVNQHLAEMDLDKPEEVRERLNEIGRASSRAKDLVRQILAFSRQHESEARQQQPLGPIVQEAMGLVRASLPATIEISQQVAADAPPVLADATQVHQVVMNLCTNAAHAMRGRAGRLTVTLAGRSLDAAQCRAFPGLQPGSYAHLTVEDTGHGMSDEVLAHIFEPFFTTKGPGEGTGLGLAVVHGIMKDHGGGIFVRSRPGAGTTFELFFPEALTAGAELAAPEVKIIPGHGESVLVVDDEAAVGEAVGSTLRKLGYRVEVFADPEAALARFQSAPAAFDLLLTDHTMPRVTGPELISRMQARRPDLPVLVMSGLSRPARELAAGAPEEFSLIAKPPNIAELSLAVRRALASSFNG